MSKRLQDPANLGIDPELVNHIVARLEERLDPIVEGLMVTYRARIPSYAAAPPSFLEEVRTGTTLSFHAGLAILRGRTDVSDVIAPLEELGRRRAAQGIPLGEALLAWQISASTFWENILELAPEDPETRAQVITLSTRVILELLQTSVTALSAGYLEADQERVADEEMDLQGIVEILAGIRSADRHYEERAACRGIDLSGVRWCVVSHGNGDASGQLARTWRGDLRGSVVGRVAGAVVAFVSVKELPASLDGPNLGVAEASDTKAGFRRARAASLVAEHLNRSIVRYEQVVPLAMILDAPREERVAFVKSQLGRLDGDPMAEDLLRSLEVYFAKGQSVAAAARALHVHRHTLEYRLERVSALLGDFREPGRRPFLEFALALRDKN